jgi:hypothetical protein
VALDLASVDAPLTTPTDDELAARQIADLIASLAQTYSQPDYERVVQLLVARGDAFGQTCAAVTELLRDNILRTRAPELR